MRFNFLSVHFRKEVHRSENKKHFSRDTPSNRTTERATCDLRLDQRRPSIRSQRRDRSRKCGVQNVRFTMWSITSPEVAKSGISYVIIITISKTNAYHSFYVTDPYSSSLSVSAQSREIGHDCKPLPSVRRLPVRFLPASGSSARSPVAQPDTEIAIVAKLQMLNSDDQGWKMISQAEVGEG